MVGSADKSWSFAILSAWVAFAVLVLAFGVIPSEFIGWFNKRWNDPNLQRFIRDPIVVGYHIVVFGAMIVGAVKYQEWRERKVKEEPGAKEPERKGPRSWFGRPLARSRG
ncbi:MAG: hypothetical protein C4318_00270 [Acidimicrobiia bacterium]